MLLQQKFFKIEQLEAEKLLKAWKDQIYKKCFIGRMLQNTPTSGEIESKVTGSDREVTESDWKSLEMAKRPLSVSRRPLSVTSRPQNVTRRPQNVLGAI